MTQVEDIAGRLQPYILPGIIVLVIAVFSPVAWHDFINFDDDVFVYANQVIKSGLTLHGIRWAFTTAHEVNWIPLTWMSHMLDVQLFGLNAGAHHVVNLLIHAASTGLLYLFLKRVTGFPWRSAAVAVLFGLHPLHVESVAWVAERKDVLSAFFGMLTLIAYARYCEKTSLHRYFATVLLFMLGLLSKPMLVSLPLVLLVLDYWPLRRLEGAGGGEGAVQQTSLLRLLAEKVPFFLLSATSSIITYLVQQSGGELFQGYTLGSRVGKAFIAYITYLYKMIWPVDLAVLYPFPKYPPGMGKIIACIIILLVVSAAVVCLRKRAPYLAVGWGWYIITLLPVIGLIQIGNHSVADRYTYIPLIGVFIMIAWGLPELLAGWRWRNVFLAGTSALVLVTIILLTSMQLRLWKNSISLFTHTLSVTTDNWVIQNDLGLAYLDKGKISEAIQFFKESVNSKPSYVLAQVNLGVVLFSIDQVPAAIDTFNLALKFDPKNPVSHYCLGQIYLLKGDHARAMQEYQTLLLSGSNLAPQLLEMINNPRLAQPGS